MPYPGRTQNSLFPFTPTIDGEFLIDFPYRLFEEGRFVKVPSIFGYVTRALIIFPPPHNSCVNSDDTDEGTIFAANASTPADVTSFMLDNFPQLSANDTRIINELYPLQTPNPFLNHAPFFASASAAYGETTFVCPGLIMSAAIEKKTSSWNYR